MSSLAAVQADGFYIPPSQFDPKRGRGSANAVAGSHPLGARAKRLRSEGILTVRFEMPLDAVCLRCGHFVSHGVRFNAAKRATGASYLSTPIQAFTMACPAACGQDFLIETDPQHADYLFKEGLRRKVKDFVPDEGDGLGRAGGSLLACAAVTEGRAAAQQDGMLRLQQAVEDSVRAGRAAAEQEALLAAGALRREAGTARAAWAALGAARSAAELAAAEGRARGLAMPMAGPPAAGALAEDRRTVALALGGREEARAEALRAGPAPAPAGSSSAHPPILPAALRASLLAAPLALQQRKRPAAPPTTCRSGSSTGAAGASSAASRQSLALTVPPPQQQQLVRATAAAAAPHASTAGFSPALLGIIAAGRKRRVEEEAQAREAAEGGHMRIAAGLRAVSGRAPQVWLGMGPRPQSRGSSAGLGRAGFTVVPGAQ